MVRCRRTITEAPVGTNVPLRRRLHKSVPSGLLDSWPKQDHDGGEFAPPHEPVLRRARLPTSSTLETAKRRRDHASPPQRLPVLRPSPPSATEASRNFLPLEFDC